MRVYIKEENQKAMVYNALTNEKIGEFGSVAEAVKFAVDNSYQLPVRDFNGHFVADKEGNFVYIDDKGFFELADGTLLQGVKQCPKCGWITYGQEVCDEDKEPRECYVCPQCGNVFECTPEPEDIGEGD